MNYQSFLDFHVLQVTLYKKIQKFNWISFFHECNQVLFWQDPSKTTSLIVTGLVTNGLRKTLFLMEFLKNIFFFSFPKMNKMHKGTLYSKFFLFKIAVNPVFATPGIGMPGQN